MASPTITSVSFDKSVYGSGDTVTSTVTYESSNGDAEDVEFSLSVKVTESGNISVSSLDANAVNLAGFLTSFSTDSVSVVAGSLVVLWIDYASGYITSVSGLGGSWSQLAVSGRLEAWGAVFTESASGEVTVNFSLGQQYVPWDLVQVTNVDLSSPVVSSNTQLASGNSGTAQVTFSPANKSKNLFLVGFANYYPSAGGGLAPGESPAWTELTDTQAWTGSEGGRTLETQVSPDASGLTASAVFYEGQTGHWDAVGLELSFLPSDVWLAPDGWTLVSNNVGADGTGTAVFQAVAQ